MTSNTGKARDWVESLLNYGLSAPSADNDLVRVMVDIYSAPVDPAAEPLTTFSVSSLRHDED